MQEVEDHHRVEDVQFEVALGAAERDRDIVPKTCTATIVIASHCVGLTLPGMID